MRAMLTRILIVAGLVLGFGVAILGVTAGAAPAAAPACGTVLLSGSSWLGGVGVDVHSNGQWQASTTGNSCGNYSRATPAQQDGYAWQCVELATRLYAVRGWGAVQTGGNSGAVTIPDYSKAPLVFHPNGTGYVPVPGDLIIYNNGTYGHVSIVNSVSGSTIHVVEQNASLSGQNTLSMSGSSDTIAGSIRGVEHSTNNHNISSGGGSGSSLVRTVPTSDGHIQLFEVAGGVVKQNWYSPSNGAIGGWTQSAGLGAQAVGAPSVVPRSGQSVVDIFVRGGDNQVYETWYNWGTGAWGGWIGMGGAISSDPQAVATPDGHDQVFGTGNGLVKESWFSPGNGAVGGWVTSAGLGAGANGSPAIVARSGQSVVDAFVRGGDNQVYETWYNWGTGAWGGWIGMGGAISSDPQAVATSDGHDQVFGTGNGLVKESWFSPGNGAVGGWVTSAGLGAGANGSPAIVARSGQSVVDAFVRGGDNQVYETWYNWGTGAWGGWIGMGGAISSDPQAVATSDGHDQVFGTGNGLVKESWFSPGNGAVGGWISF